MKKIIMLLALCLLLPAMALADCPVTVTGENTADAYSWDETTRTLTIKENGLTLDENGSSVDYGIVVEKGVTELTIENIQIHAGDRVDLTVKDNLTLTVKEELTLSGIDVSGETPPLKTLIAEGCKLTIAGSGTVYMLGKTKGDLTLDSLSEVRIDGIVEGNVHVTGGSDAYMISGSVEGVITLSNENAKVSIGSQYKDRAALIGGLNVSAGELTIRGGYSYYSRGGYGMRLTTGSIITGGKVTIAGGHSREQGGEALIRENGATLTVSGGSLTLKGGVYQSQKSSVSPDYTRPSAALSGENARALVWKSPMQMRTYQYDGAKDKYKDEADAFGPQDLAGRHVIQSVAGAWVVSYDANGGEGAMPGRIVMDKDPYNIIQTCAFTREGYAFDGWEVIVNGQKMDYMPTITVTADTTIRALWKELPNNGGSGAAADNLPKTGDPSCLAGWAALLLASAAGAGAMRRRKH